MRTFLRTIVKHGLMPIFFIAAVLGFIVLCIGAYNRLQQNDTNGEFVTGVVLLAVGLPITLLILLTQPKYFKESRSEYLFDSIFWWLIPW